MKIKLLASESQGTRSMATYIEAYGLKIFIDPGVSLAPRRYGLPPHPLEIKEKHDTWRRIVKYASASDIIILTHYHFDHFNPNDSLSEIYDDKLLFMKDPENNINHSQRRRSHLLLHKFQELNISPVINIADDNRLEIENLKITFSKPIPHGPDIKLGYVIMVCIDDGYTKFVYTSDVEGPYDDEAVDFILKCNPSILYVDGPLTYMISSSLPQNTVKKSFENLVKIILNSDISKIILDHHFMRDIDYKYWLDKLDKSLSFIDKDLYILSAAEYMGNKLRMLEAMRKRLYEAFPVKGG